MAWYDTLGDVIARLPADSAGQLIDHITGSNEMVGQINALLAQVARNPETAANVSTQIIGMKGIPGQVRDLAGDLPTAAKEATGLALQMKIAQIQSALPRSRWF